MAARISCSSAAFFGRRTKSHFKYTIIKPHILSYDAFESANRTGIGHHSKDEIAFPAAFL